MRKEEYFRTEWKSNLGSRAIDASGLEFYYPDHPISYGAEYWYLGYEKGIQYDPKDVADWWRESLQTKEQYLGLQNQKQSSI